MFSFVLVWSWFSHIKKRSGKMTQCVAIYRFRNVLIIFVLILVDLHRACSQHKVHSLPPQILDIWLVLCTFVFVLRLGKSTEIFNVFPQTFSYSYQEGHYTKLPSTVNVKSSKHFLKVVKMSTKQIRSFAKSSGFSCLLSGVCVLSILIVLIDRLKLQVKALLLFCSLVRRPYTLPHCTVRELL